MVAAPQRHPLNLRHPGHAASAVAFRDGRAPAAESLVARCVVQRLWLASS
ncbi:hypothetical protein HMPREF0321_2787 [Dermacoccus sp. Ellin185]|nr:hypothetical protein HMPREF0321_2787 [Dermacoccus sp. Ellin185]